MDDPAGLCGMTEKQFKQRLLKYAKQNPEDQQNTLVFFDEIENHAQWLDVSSRGYDEPAQLITFLAMLHKIGRPHNYGLTDEEKKASAIRDEITRLERSAKQEECRQKQEEANRPEQIIKEAAWKKQLELLQMEEYAKRELMAMPVQQYLYKYVFPTVHDGLLQCGRLLPSDPVDFLAEYLLQKSKPSNWSESNRLFEVRKRLEAKPAAEREATIIADAIAAAGAGDAPAPVVEEKQFFIAETAHMFADLSERLSLADVELASEAAYMTLDLSESTLNAALAKAGSVPKEIELANKAITNV
ncbi:putative Adenylate kinase 7 [Hypsibius exemplaris]|uniref:Adenylate kinase 7 n=1 Tax=Hypsibius exemplaris TaxID=2072580 RepID=A0A1W0WR78_HYPEX|nr:putative Adenylate kinase 7 [Hypsibius exemplaris]